MEKTCTILEKHAGAMLSLNIAMTLMIVTNSSFLFSHENTHRTFPIFQQLDYNYLTLEGAAGVHLSGQLYDKQVKH